MILNVCFVTFCFVPPMRTWAALRASGSSDALKNNPNSLFHTFSHPSRSEWRYNELNAETISNSTNQAETPTSCILPDRILWEVWPDGHCWAREAANDQPVRREASWDGDWMVSIEPIESKNGKDTLFMLKGSKCVGFLCKQSQDIVATCQNQGLVRYLTISIFSKIKFDECTSTNWQTVGGRQRPDSVASSHRRRSNSWWRRRSRRWPLARGTSWPVEWISKHFTREPIKRWIGRKEKWNEKWNPLWLVENRSWRDTNSAVPQSCLHEEDGRATRWAYAYWSESVKFRQ